MALRTVVFLDWQNVYMRARGAFCVDGDMHFEGQVNPVALAERLVARVADRELTDVRIYRGLPTNAKNPKGYGAARRQAAAWARESPRPTVYLRPLQYMEGFEPREKGIDVQLAIDFTVMAVKREYDVGILFSVDTDLKPALDAVLDLQEREGDPVPEVAAWRGPYTRPRRIAPSGSKTVPCHWLDHGDYLAVQDRTDYSKDPGK